MILRQSEAVNIQDPATGNIQQSQAGFARPQDMAQAAGTAQAQQTVNAFVQKSNGDDTQMRLLSNILGTVDKLANQTIDRANDEAYLSGAAAVGRVQSETELQADPLTRDWATAGYRDTTGKLKFADAEAQMAVDMKTLREQSPAEMEAYLATRRQELNSAFSGMSYEARKNMTGQLLVSDQSAIKTHLSEHQKWIVEQQGKSISAAAATQFESLTAARKSGNPEKYLLQHAEYALATDNVDYDEALKRGDAPQATGEEDQPGASFLARLPEDKQIELAGKHREALGRVANQRDAAWASQAGAMESDMDAVTFQKWLDTGTSEHGMSSSARQEWTKKFYDYRRKWDNAGQVSAALISGDVAGLTSMGKSSAEAVSTMVDYYGKTLGMPVPAIVSYLEAAGRNGITEAYKAAGELAAPSFRQMTRPDGTVDAQHAAMVEQVLNMVNGYKHSGQDQAYTQFMAGMPKDVEERVAIMAEQTRTGATVEGALQTATKIATDNEKLSPEARAALAGNHKAAMEQLSTDLGAESSLKKWLPAFTLEQKVKDQLRPGDTWLSLWNRSDPQVISEITQRGRAAVLEEYSAAVQGNPYLTPEAARDIAFKRVSNRIVPTMAGALVLPKDTDPVTFFGVSESERNMIGPAVDKVLTSMTAGKPKPDRFVFEATRGNVMFSTYDTDGVRIDNLSVDPQAVRGAMDEVIQGRNDRTAQVLGPGTKVKSKEGTVVSYNGSTTSSMAPEVMYDFRTNLVQFEGVRDTVYADKKGVLTLGIGVSERNDAWPGGLQAGDKVPAQVVEATFRKATDAAADDGMKIANTLGLRNRPGQLLASELSYHAGRYHVKDPNYKAMYANMLAGNADAAIQAFAQTDAYRQSGTDRRNHYLALIQVGTKFVQLTKPQG